MNNKVYISGLVLGAILGLCSFSIMIFSFNPFGADLAVILLVFASLFLGLACISAIGSYSFLKKINKINQSFLVQISLLEGLILAGVLVALLILISQQILFGWVGMIILIVFVISQILVFRKI